MPDQPQSHLFPAALMVFGIFGAFMGMLTDHILCAALFALVFAIGWVEGREVSVFNEKLDQADSE